MDKFGDIKYNPSKSLHNLKFPDKPTVKDYSVMNLQFISLIWFLFHPMKEGNVLILQSTSLRT